MEMYIDDNGKIVFAGRVEQPVIIGRLRGGPGDYIVYSDEWDVKVWSERRFKLKFKRLSEVDEDLKVYASKDGQKYCFAVQVKHQMYVGGQLVPEGDYVICRGIARLIRKKEDFERQYEPAKMVIYTQGGLQLGT